MSNQHTKVTGSKNGPLIVEGNFRIKGVDGNFYPKADKVFLCQCGKSLNKPFCDGSHKK